MPYFTAQAADSARRPNVVLIVADDLGWSDTAPYGNTKFHKTPNLTRLAESGLLCLRAYAASPLCSPTRASILTGLSPARVGITAPNCHLPEVRMKATLRSKTPPALKTLTCDSATRLDTSYFTMNEAFAAAGYTTGHFGKWHLGPTPYSPLEHGFGVDLPHTPGPGPAGSYVAPWKFKDFKERSPAEHIEDRMGDEAVAFLEKNKDRPFFLNYWQFSVHAPFDAKKSVIEKYRATADANSPQRSPTYAAMIEAMDDNVGKVLDALDRLGLTERTAIVFISDNGGNMYSAVDGTTPTSNAPFRGGKATLYEGGVRVPCIVRWPGVTRPGSRTEAVLQSTDFFPTFAASLGLKTPPDVHFDGIDVTDAFRGKPVKREAIFTFFPHSPKVPDALPPGVSVHADGLKLIRLFHEGPNGAHAYRLHDLRTDPGEQRDLSAAEPATTARLDALIENFLTETRAVVPTPNLAYKP